MIDYTKYDDVQTKEVHGYKGDYNPVYKALEDRETKVNKALKKIQSEGYKIIDIKYDTLRDDAGDEELYVTATIIYGKVQDTAKK